MAACAICQKPVRHFFTGLRVPSGAMPSHSCGWRAKRSLICSTTPCVLLRSTGMPPSVRTSQPSGPTNNSRLPMKEMSMPSATLTSIPQTPSHQDECGAAISTSWLTSGNSPTSFQPQMRRIQRARRRPTCDCNCGTEAGNCRGKDSALNHHSSSACHGRT